MSEDYEIKCNCYSSYEDEEGNVIHYMECDIIQARLGLL